MVQNSLGLQDQCSNPSHERSRGTSASEGISATSIWNGAGLEGGDIGHAHLNGYKYITYHLIIGKCIVECFRIEGVGYSNLPSAVLIIESLFSNLVC